MAFHLPAGPLPRAALLLAAAAVVLLALLGGRRIVEHRGQVQELERLRSGLADLRADAEACQLAVRREEQSFARYRAEVDSLRREVREFEAMDERGVPAEAYEEYLEVFDDYNEAVPLWEERADTLRARELACRALVERHNALADSLQAFVERAEGGG